MPSPSNEQTVLTSNDGTITLTTHRVLARSQGISNELMLSDYISYQVINKRAGYYKVLSVVLFVITAICGIFAAQKYQDSQRFISRLRDAFNQSGITNAQEFELVMNVFWAREK